MTSFPFRTKNKKNYLLSPADFMKTDLSLSNWVCLFLFFFFLFFLRSFVLKFRNNNFVQWHWILAMQLGKKREDETFLFSFFYFFFFFVEQNWVERLQTNNSR